MVILGALSKMNESFLSSEVRLQSGGVPGTSWDTNMENQERNEDLSQNGLLREVDATVKKSSLAVVSELIATVHKYHLQFIRFPI